MVGGRATGRDSSRSGVRTRGFSEAEDGEETGAWEAMAVGEFSGLLTQLGKLSVDDFFSNNDCTDRNDGRVSGWCLREDLTRRGSGDKATDGGGRGAVAIRRRTETGVGVQEYDKGEAEFARTRAGV